MIGILRCRICKSEDIHKFLSLGPTPLANSFLKKEQLDSPEPVYPLDVYFCNNCGLAQLVDIVPPDVLFKDYIYVSGTSDTMQIHFTQLAKEVVEKFDLSPNSLVADIGGNDGTLLKAFRNFNVKTLNVEPATNVAKIAEEAGIETVNDFWNERTALKISKDKGKAKVILGTNVFAHVDNLDDFLRGIDILLSDDGVFIIEVPYLVNLLDKKEFDTIYHEHLSYFAIRPLATLFKRFGMEVFDVKRVGVHGGSIRVYVRKSLTTSVPSESVDQLLALEKKLKLDSLSTYQNFASQVELIRKKLLALLKELKAKGKKVVGYGAPAKGNTLLNYFKIGTELLEYTVDKSQFKQGLYTPGMHIPVYPVEKLLEDVPDYVLILAWNFADEILKQQQKYQELGGKFIIPIPEPKII